jgi:hypothetical protein
MHTYIHTYIHTNKHTHIHTHTQPYDFVCVVGKAHHYEVYGSGSNSGGGEIIRTCPDRPCGPPSLLYNGYRISFPRVSLPGFGVNYPPHSSTQVKETVELYWCTLSGSLLPVPQGEIYLYLLLYLCRQIWIRHFCSLLYDTIECPPEGNAKQNIYFPCYHFSSRKTPRCRVFQDCINVGLRTYISKLTVCSIRTKLSLVSKFLLHCLQTRTVSTPVSFVLKPQYIDDWLTVQHRSITLFDLQLDAQNSYSFTYNTFIKILYMFRALPCSTSGGLRRNCIYAASGFVTLCR